MYTAKPVDNYKHQGLRKLMVQNIRQKGISDSAILQALEKVPRHFFLDSSFLESAYEDRPFSIGAEQTISQPFTVAFQSDLLQIKRGDKVLEIGTGSGYQACILFELGAKVFTIERQKSLFERTHKFLPLIGYPTIKTFFGDGYKGLPSFAPFDKIIVTAAAPHVPEPLLDQLKAGGILVIPVGANETQIMTTFCKQPDGTFIKKEYGSFRFVPMLEDKTKS